LENSKALFAENFLSEWQILISCDIKKVRDEMSEIKKNVNILIQKTDQFFDSVAYMSDEYDDFNLKVSKTA